MKITERISKVINKFLRLILKNSENAAIKPVPFFHYITVFNEYFENGYIIIALDSWKYIHSSIVNIILKYSDIITFGIVYSKKPSKNLNIIINIIKKTYN